MCIRDRDTIRSNIFANTAIRFVQGLPEARLLKSVVVPFEMGVPERPDVYKRQVLAVVFAVQLFPGTVGGRRHGGLSRAALDLGYMKME